MSEFESSLVPLQIQLSEAVSSDTLEMLHAEGLDGDLPADLRELFRTAWVARISAVHRLSSEEIQNDRYGFARDFKLYIRAGYQPDTAIEKLKSSFLVQDAKPIALRQS